MHDDRTALITGLLDMAAFLEANPEIPVSLSRVTIHAFPGNGSDAEMCSHVDKIAAYMGAEIDRDALAYGHYMTGLDFGPVRYEYTAILAAARARHDAEYTYRGCIKPNAI